METIGGSSFAKSDFAQERVSYFKQELVSEGIDLQDKLAVIDFIYKSTDGNTFKGIRRSLIDLYFHIIISEGLA